MHGYDKHTHSNTLWHTDFKQLDNGQWFLCYEDDASRFVTGYGVFDKDTTENALDVMCKAIAAHGKPASIMTDHGAQFFANESEKKQKGISKFGQKLADLNIKQILAGVRHPQTNGKLERLHGEIQRKLHMFEDVADPPGTACPVNSPKIETEPIARFMQWYNYDRPPHMSLDWDNQETPAMAFVRKMPTKGETVVDEQTKEEYLVE